MFVKAWIKKSVKGFLGLYLGMTPHLYFLLKIGLNEMVQIYRQKLACTSTYFILHISFFCSGSQLDVYGGAQMSSVTQASFKKKSFTIDFWNNLEKGLCWVFLEQIRKGSLRGLLQHPWAQKVHGTVFIMYLQYFG